MTKSIHDVSQFTPEEKFIRTILYILYRTQIRLMNGRLIAVMNRLCQKIRAAAKRQSLFAVLYYLISSWIL